MARETTRSLTAAGAHMGRVTPRYAPQMANSLRGSAKVDTLASREAAATGGQAARGFSKGWQQQMWTYFDEIGELGYTLGFIGNCLARCTLTIGVRDNRGRAGPAFDDEGNPLADGAEEALGIVQALSGPTGGQAQLLASFGPNLGGAGEAYLVGTPPDGQTATEADIMSCAWEVLSTDEFAPSGENYLRRRTPGGTPEEIPGNAVHVVRIWRSHPRFSQLPHSSVRPLLDILEELHLLTREVRADAQSRLSNGNVLCIPEEIEWKGDAGDDGEGDDGDPFTRDLIYTMATPVQDKGSAAALVPYVLRGPADLLHPDKLRTIDLSRKTAGDSASKRKEAVLRFAQGIDLPVEIVTGHAGTTFANAVVIDDSTFKVHIEPLLDLIVDALTIGFLQPAMASVGRRLNPFVVTYDSTELVSRPNRSQDAKDGYDRFEISGATLRSVTGFSDSDAPDEDEIKRRIEIKQLTQVRQTIPTTPAALEGEDTQLQAMGPDGAPITQGPLDQNNDQSLAASIAAMAELAVEQSIIRAGGRLRSNASKNRPALREQLAQVPSAEVPVTLGPALVERLSGDEDLFYGQFDTLWSLVVRMTGDQNYADALRAACVEIATDRLYQPRRSFPTTSLPRLGERAVLSAVAR